MLPAYFLSILFNALAGYILTFGKEKTETGELSFSLNNEKVRLVIGVLAFVTGIVKILSPVAGNVPVVGDLFPALAGLAGGSTLIFGFYRRKLPENDSFDTFEDDAVPLSKGNVMERIAALTGKSRKIIGFVCIGTAALHFIFYSVLFL